MAEQQHHLAWMANAPSVITKAETVGVSPELRRALEQERATCLAVLGQNAASQVAVEYLGRIERLLADGTTKSPEMLQENEEQRCLRDIEVYERHMAEWGQVILPRIENLPNATPKDMALRRDLAFPFEAFAKNANNPRKNRMTVERLAGGNTFKLYSTLCQNAYDNTFTVDFADRRPELGSVNIAGYEPLQCTMCLPRPSEQASLLRLITLYHECYHIPQQNKRLNANPEQCARMRKELGNYVIVEDECQAYGMELEVLNVHCEGRLKQESLSGPIPQNVLTDALQPEGKEWMMVEMLRQFAEEYFKGCHAPTNTYTDAYKALVTRCLLNDGYNVYSIAPQGGLTRIRQA